MFIRDLKKCEEFVAVDGCILRELFNPLEDDVEPRYSLAHAVVKPGEKSIKHRLKASEVYYILKGKGLMHIDDEAEEVSLGQAIIIPSMGVQWIENTGNEDLIFLCIVDPAWQPEIDENIEK